MNKRNRWAPIIALMAGAGFAAEAAVSQPSSAALSSDDPVAMIEAVAGRWATQGFGAVVDLHACADAPAKLCGTLSWAWDDEEIPSAAIGSLMLSGAELDDGAFRRGELLNPEDGRLYRGKITPIDADRLHLRGCAARILCQTQVWRRLESLPHACPRNAARRGPAPSIL
ncbi:MAG: DUF2147 domain-containing protein [Pseudomonadota bacterium]